MKENAKNKKGKAWQNISLVIFALISGFAGYLLAMTMTEDLGLWIFPIAFGSVYINIIIHEAGHLVFGLLSGYKFSSFRIASLMLTRDKGNFAIRRLKVTGTGGQCLMVPPDMKDGRIPVILYNLGGSLLNLLFSSVFLTIYLIKPETPYLSSVMLAFSVMGFLATVTNGVPLRIGAVDNDGYNAFALTRDPDAMESFWVQLKISEQSAMGVRLKAMPSEWFILADHEGLKNSMIAVRGVFTCNRLMDEGNFEAADRMMEDILSCDSGMVELHRRLLICDRIYVELIRENRRDILEGMLDKKQKRFMKQMKRFPAVIRTEYTYALLRERDETKAEKLKKKFEKCAKSYPYQSDIQSERELIERAEALKPD